MKNDMDILELFSSIYKEDKSYIKSWLIRWSYQDKLISRNVNYSDDLPQDFYGYTGPSDIVEWMNWAKNEKPQFFDQKKLEPLIRLSQNFDEQIISKYNLQYDFTTYKKGLGLINAQDYIIANSIPEKTSNKKIVLDFGSGFGRQANIWNQLENENYVHISVDAIVKSYCLQWLYYSNFEREFHEYAIEKSAFILDEKSKGIYHLPTWRMDLIPSNYVDKITVVQVFQELNADLVKYIVKEFYRILKPNGSIYVRDHGNAWRPAHKLNMDKYLMNNGFTLEYKMHALDKIDIHGIPRIFRKTNNIAKNQEKVSMQQFIYEKKREFDSLTGGRLNKLIKKIKHK